MRSCYSYIRIMRDVISAHASIRSCSATKRLSFLLKRGIRRTLKTKIFDGSALPQSLSMRYLTVCRVDILPKHKVPYHAYKILHDRSHVLYLPARKRFQAILDGCHDERQEGLRMEIISNSMAKKRVVRSWARRRVDQAVTGALIMRGFDRNGRRLVDPDASITKVSEPNGSPVNLTMNFAPDALIGSVEIHVLDDSIGMSFTEVQRQAGLVVDKILEICGRYLRHR